MTSSPIVVKLAWSDWQTRQAQNLPLLGYLFKSDSEYWKHGEKGAMKQRALVSRKRVGSVVIWLCFICFALF